MKLLFISDIHGNHLALEAMLNHIDAKCADKIYCCGDICGYFTNINEVVDLLIKHDVVTIMGNHDAIFLNRLPLDLKRSYFQSHLVSREKISKRSYDYIESLPLTLSFEYGNTKFSLYHGGMSDPLNERIFPAKIDVREYASDVQIFGHTHLQFGVERRGLIFLNPGTIGLPRNGDFRVHYLLFNTETFKIEARQIPYDVNAMINEALTQKDTDFRYIHNLNFGRSSTKQLKRQSKKNIILKQLKENHPKISVINTNFGLILTNDDFKSGSPILYLAFYQDDSVEISSSPVIFNWQAGDKITSFISNKLLKQDAAGFYYFKSFDNLERFVHIVADEVYVAFELITKYKIQNVQI